MSSHIRVTEFLIEVSADTSVEELVRKIVLEEEVAKVQSEQAGVESSSERLRQLVPIKSAIPYEQVNQSRSLGVAPWKVAELLVEVGADDS